MTTPQDNPLFADAFLASAPGNKSGNKSGKALAPESAARHDKPKRRRPAGADAGVGPGGSASDAASKNAPPTERSAHGYALVALERGIDVAEGGLTYAVPEALADVAVGDRVTVPLGRGNKPASGYVVGLIDKPDPAIKAKRFKAITSRNRVASSLPADLVTLAGWIAGYYCCPLGMVFGSMLPAAVKRAAGTKTRTQVRPKTQTDPKADDASAKKLTKLQRAVLDAAQADATTWYDPKALADLVGAKSTSSIKQLLDKGLLEARQHESLAPGFDLQSTPAPGNASGGGGALGKIMPELMPAQAHAVDRLTESLDAGFSVHLLHGITGSGKTEVYLRTIETLLKLRGQQAKPANASIQDGQTQGAQTQGDQVQGNQVPSSASASPPTSALPNPLAPSAPCPGVIVLVPEIALTPQTVGRFLARFPDGNVAVLHSGLTASQRHAQWQRIRDGKASVVVGARSAIFAPLPSVDLIIVDEEHESSYKQDQLPRYHARDVAIKRAQLARCPVLLGSATPSLESYHNAAAGKAQLLELPDRIPGAHLPKVEIVDLAEERRQRKGIHLLSARLETALKKNLDAGGQAILLLNRRGYANYLACPDHTCGWMMRCDHCDVTMVYHRSPPRSPPESSPGSYPRSSPGNPPRSSGGASGGASGGSAARQARAKGNAGPPPGYTRCHHCGAEQMLASVCPESGHKVSVFGLGTQKVEEELVRKFPDARLTRMDADAMRSAKDYQTALDAFATGQTDILLGTQMIAKGLDVPNVRLVGVVSADTSLNFPDFRASERTFQLIAQVAGRAGRGEHRGAVIVQTFNPDDPAIMLASAHDYKTFAVEEIQTRTANGLPPVGRMARIVLRDTDDVANKKRAHQLATALHQANDQLQLNVRLRGPSVCPIARIADHHRQHIELLSEDAASIQKLLTALRNAGQLISDTHTAIDVDPVSLL